MFKYILQIIIGIFILAFSTFFAWYEGSAIIDIPWEWKYSTPFSNLLNIEVVEGQDISQLDYFVYAAKYQPLFPATMLLSIVYIFNVVGHYLITHQPKWGLIFLGGISCVLLLFGSFVFNSSVVGGRIFFWITLMLGLINLTVTVFFYFKNRNSSICP